MKTTVEKFFTLLFNGGAMLTTKQLCDQGLQLPAEDRMALVDQLLDTLDERDSTLDTPWAHEAESRLTAYRRGETQGIPLNEVLAKYTVKPA